MFLRALALGELGLEKGIAMNKFKRNLRLVCALLNFFGGISRMIAALVDAGIIYLNINDAKMGAQV
jgi:hypothetical protein